MELPRRFKQALATEVRALEHRQAAELVELRAAQKAGRAEFEAKERAARHEFFATHPSGKEKQSYVRSFYERRRAYDLGSKQAIDRRKAEQAARRAALLQEQKERRAAFEAALQRGEIPVEALWKSGL